MTPLDAAALVLCLALPLHWMVVRHLTRLEDPAYLRRHGIVIERESTLEHCAAPIGAYLGRPIPGAVTFMGMEYRFAHVIAHGARERIGPGELYLAPGLVYRLAG